MRFFTALSLALLASVARAEVLTLTTDSLDAAVAEHPLLFVAFYAPWCGHCKALLPELDDAAEELAGEAVAVAKVDVTEEESLYWRYEIQAYPTLKLFVDGAVDAPVDVPDSMDRSAAGVVAFLRGRVSPLERFAAAEDALHAADLASPSSVVVGVGLDAAAEAELASAARRSGDATVFGVLAEGASAADLGASLSAPLLLLLKPYDERVVEAAFADVPELEAWVAASSRPRVLRYAEEFLDLMFSNDFRVHVLVFVEGGEDPVLDAVTAAASEVDQLFVVLEAVDAEYIGPAMEVDLEEGLPAVRIAHSHDERLDKFKSDAIVDGVDPSAADLVAFVRSFAAGELEPFDVAGDDDDSEGDEGGDGHDDAVLKLTDETFDDVVESVGGAALVMFYAPWCGHCKSMAPDFAEAAAMLAEHGVLAAKVDATENEALTARFNVGGFPTTVLVHPEGVAEYEGDRTAADLVSFAMNGGALPPPAPIETLEDLHQAVRAAGSLSLVVSTPRATIEEGAEEQDAFLLAAGAVPAARFAYVVGAEVQALLGLSDGGVALLRPTGPELAPIDRESVELAPAVELPEDFDFDFDDYYGMGDMPFGAEAVRCWIDKFDGEDDLEIAMWAEQRARPLVTSFNEENAPMLFETALAAHLLVFIDAEHTETETKEALIAAMAEAAAADRSMQMILIDVHNEPEVSAYLQVTDETKLPCARITSVSEQMGIYHLPAGEEITGEALAKFAVAFGAGELTPNLLSENADEVTDLSAALPALVADNLAEVAGAADSDALVFFYAPWCPHCTEFEPKYEIVADYFADNDKVLIAKMDATANDVLYEGVEVTGFPTLYLFPSDAQPVEYSGAMEAQDVIDFVEGAAASSSEQEDHSEL